MFLAYSNECRIHNTDAIRVESECVMGDGGYQYSPTATQPTARRTRVIAMQSFGWNFQ
jgi:hypothetical protein